MYGGFEFAQWLYEKYPIIANIIALMSLMGFVILIVYGTIDNQKEKRKKLFCVKCQKVSKKKHFCSRCGYNLTIGSR